MMLWYPRAVRKPGPASRLRNGAAWGNDTLAAENSVLGAVCHSAGGSRWGLDDVLRDPSRVSAWQFEDWKDGTIVQRYPLTAIVYTSGHRWAHENTMAVECEGGPPSNPAEPLTEAQIASLIDLLDWIAAQGGWALERAANGKKTLWEHNEFQPTTACPSGRIPWGTILAPREQPEEEAMDYYVVRPGGSLWRASQDTGLSIDQLVRLNAIPDPSRIEAWQVLRLNEDVPKPEILRLPATDEIKRLALEIVSLAEGD